MKISQATPRFLDYCESIRRLSQHTVRAYQCDLRDFCRFLGDKGAVQDCDRETIHRYFKHLSVQRSLKATTVRRRLACLRVCFRWFRKEGIILFDPIQDLEAEIKIPRTLPRALSIHQVAAIIGIARRRARIALAQGQHAQSCQGHSVLADLTGLVATELMYATGIRVGELVAISLGDLDVESGVVRIQGKGNRERLVFIPTERLTRLLERYLEIRRTAALGTRALLVSRNGLPATDQQIRVMISRLGKAAEIPFKVTPHMLRHSTATHLLEQGVDIRYVQRLLGHQSISTTEIYTYVGDHQLRKKVCEAHKAISLI